MRIRSSVVDTWRLLLTSDLLLLWAVNPCFGFFFSWLKLKQCWYNRVKPSQKNGDDNLYWRYLSLWDSDETDVDQFIEQANKFHPTIKFTAEISDSRADMCLNCSLSVKSTKIGTNMVFNELIKVRYGDQGASCAQGLFMHKLKMASTLNRKLIPF